VGKSAPWGAPVPDIAALYTSRDHAVSECLLQSRQAAQDVTPFDDLERRHAAAWQALWDRFDIRLDAAHERAGMILHLHSFHLLQTVSPNSIPLDVGVPARGWTGEAYRGHVFGGRQREPVPGLQAGRRADAAVPALPRQTARPAARPGV
jgi:hypothetical protein